jgi:hypothetical protein
MPNDGLGRRQGDLLAIAINSAILAHLHSKEAARQVISIIVASSFAIRIYPHNLIIFFLTQAASPATTWLYYSQCHSQSISGKHVCDAPFLALLSKRQPRASSVMTYPARYLSPEKKSFLCAKVILFLKHMVSTPDQNGNRFNTVTV